jgi:hypothetical protein
MQYRPIVMILTLAGALLAHDQVTVSGREDSEILSRQISHDIDRTGRPGDVHMQVLKSLGLSGGMVLALGCSDPSSVTFKAMGGTKLRAALADFATKNPEYRWQVRGGTLDLVPEAGVPAVLATRIHGFELHTTDQQSTAGVAVAQLLALPEVRQRVAHLRLKSALQQGGPGAYTEHPVPRQAVPIHIKLKNVSLQEAFNSVVKAFGESMWVFVEHECSGEKTYSVDTLKY